MGGKRIQDLISEGEIIVWQGKPRLVHYVLGRLFSIGSVIAIAFMAFVFWCYWVGYHREARALAAQASLVEWGFIIFMYLFTTFMAWAYLGGILAEIFAYGNVECVVTNLGIYASGGVFRFSCRKCNFSDYQGVKITHGLLDFCFDIGNVEFKTPIVWEYKSGTWTGNERAYVVSINSFMEFREVYNLVKSMGWDTYVNGKDCNLVKSDLQQDGQKKEEWDWKQ